MPIVAVWAFLLDGIFIGATQGKAMRNAMIWSLAVYIGASLILVPLWQNHGLWLALMLFMAIRGVTLGMRYPALERGIGGESAGT